MNNYEEEYFEDENDLEEEHFGDFVDFWDDTPEFDEQIEEFKTALRADVKREIKELTLPRQDLRVFTQANRLKQYSFTTTRYGETVRVTAIMCAVT